MSRLEIVTSTGSFNLPMNYQVVVLKEDGTRTVKYACELLPQDTVLVNKLYSDLELSDLLPGLWAGSEEYRRDRSALFRGGGPELPKETWLKFYLEEARKHAGLTDATLLKMIVELDYSYGAGWSWRNGKIMFPEKPEVLSEISKRTGYIPLWEWASRLSGLPPKERPQLRVSTTHRAVMSALSLPRGGGKGETKTRKHGHIINVASLLKTLEGVYSPSLKEANIPFRVLSIGEPKTGPGGEYETPSPTGISKKVVGFSTHYLEDASSILEKYGVRARSEEIEHCLKERARLIGSTSDYWVELALLEYDIGSGFDKPGLRDMPPKKTDRRLRALASLDRMNFVISLSGAPYFAFFVFSPIFGTKESTYGYLLNHKIKFFEQLVESKEQRKKLMNLVQSKPDKIIRDSGNTPYLSFWREKLREIFDASPIERRTLTFKDWFACVCPDFASPVESFLKRLRLKSSDMGEWSKVIEQQKAEIKNWNDVFWDDIVTPDILEIRDKCKEAERSVLPTSVIAAQDFFFPGRNQDHNERMNEIAMRYGISSFHGIGSYFIDKAEQVLGTLGYSI